MPGEEEACRKRHRQPFVRIERHRIGVLNSSNQVPVPVREKDCSAICAINMKPDVVAATKLMNLQYVVDRSRAGGSGSSNNAEWFLAGCEILLDRGLELLHIELQPFVYRN